MKKKIRIVSMLLTVVLLMSAFVTPVAAGQGNGRGQEQGLPVALEVEGAEILQAITLAERFLKVRSDGMLDLNMPRRMIRSIGDDVHAQLQAGIVQSNEMVSQGYLIFDQNFNAHVTEKYLYKIRTALLSNEELNPAVSGVYVNENEIRILAAGSGGVTQITWHWWGYHIYLSDFVVDDIVYGGAFLLSVLAALGLSTGKALTIVAVIGAIPITGLAALNRRNTGLRFSFS
ncbi:MAG: hypothetical protein KGZ56_05795 [Dethiobacter sp.]|nr:hypothetical protein [Dethiobacter sp.]MBS3898463.1 hypothetical protein [Dethiobacter sp.]MCL4464307.1 hypothetical protein [Bacillota bacterium]